MSGEDSKKNAFTGFFTKSRGKTGAAMLSPTAAQAASQGFAFSMPVTSALDMKPQETQIDVMPIERFKEEMSLLIEVQDKIKLLRSQFSIDPTSIDLS
jgi:hypothetical protein